MRVRSWYSKTLRPTRSRYALRDRMASAASFNANGGLTPRQPPTDPTSQSRFRRCRTACSYGRTCIDCLIRDTWLSRVTTGSRSVHRSSWTTRMGTVTTHFMGPARHRTPICRLACPPSWRVPAPVTCTPRCPGSFPPASPATTASGSSSCPRSTPPAPAPSLARSRTPSRCRRRAP
jgi:hypothetical protein